MKRFSLILACLVATAAAGCSQPAANTASTTDQPAAADGKKAMPSFEVANIKGGSIKSADLQGKVALVDFWATWCEPCKAEIPNYNALYEKYAGKDFRMIGMTVQSGDLEDIKPEAEKLQMKYPVVVGSDEIAENFGGIIGWPTTFLVAKDGTIFKKYLGSPPGKLEKLEKDIDMLLAK